MQRELLTAQSVLNRGLSFAECLEQTVGTLAQKLGKHHDGSGTDGPT